MVPTYIGIDNALEAGIEVYGDDYYWTTFYPEKVRRDGISVQWWKQHYPDGMSIDDMTRTNREVRRWLLQDAVVEITGQVEINATVAEAKAYNLDYEKKHTEMFCNSRTYWVSPGLTCD